ncbi:hypothetical protein [Pseudorhodoferax sp.]|uniref:hypothetical protein n=1 Tax=Pseudorhodoferax sp. TaxID=1993553 RepID=UPI002DD691A3|nr:hypothetical protein [Pseudorhodoferax sp.]
MDSAPRPVAGRLLASLPAVYRAADAHAEQGRGELQRLLAAFERVLLGEPGAPVAQGFEPRIDALPSLWGGAPPDGGFEAATRDAFAPWIAAHWVAFAPFAHFDAVRLRRIAAGIVPLYARRGTPGYLVALLRLCFDELDQIALQEDLGGGLRVGRALLGRSTQLGRARPFVFGLALTLHPRPHGWPAAELQPLREALQAVIDFATPAHTSCELTLAPPA